MSVIGVDAKLEETLASVRDQYAIVASACSTLAGSLWTGTLDEGLQAVERICATLLITDEVISFMARAGAPRTTLQEAYLVSENMVERAAPWIEVALRELPGAELLVGLFMLAQAGARDTDGETSRH